MSQPHLHTPILQSPNCLQRLPFSSKKAGAPFTQLYSFATSNVPPTQRHKTDDSAIHVLPQVHPPPPHPPPPRISAVQSLLHAFFLPTPFKCTPRQGTHALEEALKMPEDGELGGVQPGQAVWEAFEGALKEWEKMSPPGDKKAECDDVPSVDTPSS
ncbi:hypothetical protein M405DRAFT_914833 [Rhizopogon salebrosus TDB-379]|nr:hypothetical protein M405DRAFT_914833 [Rhizopogon salebrosus TDB-379]